MIGSEITTSRLRRNLLTGKFLSHFLAASCLVLSGGLAHANAPEVDAWRSIDDLYFHRDVTGNLEKSLAESEKWITLESKDSTNGVESAFLWRRCRSLVRRGEQREKKSDKLADFDLARQDCEKSVSLSSGDADAHFWYGVSMGRWGEAKGIMKAMFLIKPIRAEMGAALKIDPKYGGAHRVLGEMLWQIPGIAGGDKKAALGEYETAVLLSPKYSSNYLVLADAYLHYKRKDDAIKTLNALLAITDSADPAEFKDDSADAKKRLAELTAK